MTDGRKTRGWLPGRFGGHFRRNIAGYVALAVALSLSPAVANHLTVKTSDIENKAVTRQKIDKGAINKSRMAPLEKRNFVGRAGQPDFKNGGEGDCIWQGASEIIDGIADPYFYMDQMGIVHLGGVAAASNGAGGDLTCDSTAGAEEREDGILFRLPSKYRPQFTEIQALNDSVATVIVGQKPLESSGFPDLAPGTVFTATTFTPPQSALDGITFRPASGGGGGAATTTSVNDPAAKRLLRQIFGL